MYPLKKTVTLPSIYGIHFIWDKNTCNKAIMDNDIKLLSEILDKGKLLFNDAYKTAVENEKYDVIKLFINKINYYVIIDEAINMANIKVLSFVINYKKKEHVVKYILCETIEKGKIILLQWILSNGGIELWEDKYMSILARNGHLHCIKLLHTHYKDIINIDNCFACLFAAEKGHLDILKWAHENNWGNTMHYEVCNTAILHKQLPVLEWAVSIGHKITSEMIIKAITNNYLEFLEWLIDNKYIIDDKYYDFVIEKNYLEVIELFKKKRVPININLYKKLNYKMHGI